MSYGGVQDYFFTCLAKKVKNRDATQNPAHFKLNGSMHICKLDYREICA